jgi:endonuclease YncB( thermonuclease family)
VGRYRYRRKTAAARLTELLVLLLIFAGVVYGFRDFGGFDLAPGNATAVDGDSLRMGKTEIRLHGIDAPEYRQTCNDGARKSYQCGKLAREELAKLIRGQIISCRSIEDDRYGRAVSDCHIDKLNINQEMVRLGWAIAYRKHSFTYVPAEQDAKIAKRGIWVGKFENPEAYRQRIKSSQSDMTGQSSFDD